MDGGASDRRPLLSADDAVDDAPLDAPPLTAAAPSTLTSADSSASASGGLSEVERLRQELAAQQELMAQVLAAQSSGTSAVPPVAAATEATAGSTAAAATAVTIASAGATTGGGDAASTTLAGEAGALSDAEIAAQMQREEAGGEGDGIVVQHDSFQTDMQYANMLQAVEMEMAARETAEGDESKQEPPHYEDPVWGKYYLGEGGGKPHQVICFSMCPCCMPPFCSPERKAVLKKIGKSVSFVFAVIQLTLLFAMFVRRGLAPMAINPMIGPWPDTLSEFGAKNSARMIWEGQIWRFLTPMMLHAGLIHFAMNALMQLRMGLYLEFKWGWKMYLLIYLGSGLVSAIASLVFIPDKIGVGASGSLMGLMGAWFVDLLVEWGDGDAAAQGNRSFQLVMCFINITIVIGFSFVPYVDWAAHSGGLLGGALIAMITFGKAVSAPRRRRMVQWGAAAVLAIFCLISLIVTYTSITPPAELLWICGEVQPAFPETNLDCGPMPEDFIEHYNEQHEPPAE